MKSVASQLRIMERFGSYEAIPPAVRAHISNKALDAGHDPVMVHAGIKAAYTKKNGKAIQMPPVSPQAKSRYPKEVTITYKW